MLLVLTNHGDSREMISDSKNHPSADITTMME